MEKKMDNIKIEGHIGTWSAISSMIYSKTSKEIFLMERDKYGDEAACLIVDADRNVILDDVWNGFDDLENLE